MRDAARYTGSSTTPLATRGARVVPNTDLNALLVAVLLGEHEARADQEERVDGEPDADARGMPRALRNACTRLVIVGP